MSEIRRRAAHRRAGAFGNSICVFCTTVVLLIGYSLSSEATAQTANFRSVDTNSDGILSFDELVAAFGETGARRLVQDNDRNGDNRITIIELRGGRDNGRQDNGKGGRGNRGERDNGDDGSGERGGGDDGDDD